MSQSGDFTVTLNQLLNLYPRNQEIPCDTNSITLKEGRIYDISIGCRTMGGMSDESVRLSVVDSTGRKIVTTNGFNVEDSLNRQEFAHGHVTFIPDKDTVVNVKVTELGSVPRKVHKDSHLFIKEVDLIDEYSQTETVTRKTWLGKRVYRKVFTANIDNADKVITTGITSTYCYIESWNFVSDSGFNLSNTMTYKPDPAFTDINKADNNIQMSITSNGSKIISQFPETYGIFKGKLYVVLEYCK